MKPSIGISAEAARLIGTRFSYAMSRSWHRDWRIPGFRSLFEMAAALLNTICRGLVGHVSYLATCSLSTVYSEYLLYEPIARIAQSKGYIVRCEVPAGIKPRGPGDYPRFDFQLTKGDRSIALEC
jgi:hypothetical protein